jgi:hypothetical protein
MRLLVTGDRRWHDPEQVALEIWRLRPRLEVVLHGGRPGVERIAAREARRLGIPTEVYPDATILTEGRPTYMYRFGISLRALDLEREFTRLHGRGSLTFVIAPDPEHEATYPPNWNRYDNYGGPHC